MESTMDSVKFIRASYFSNISTRTKWSIGWLHLSLSNLRRILQNEIYFWNYYMHMVEQLNIYFQSSASKRYEKHNVRPPLKRVLLPVVICIFMMVRAIVSLICKKALDTPYKRLLWGTEILPEKGRHNLELTILFWSLLYMLFVWHGLCQPIVKFNFLATLVVHPNGKIKPLHLDLIQRDYKQFDDLRKKANLVLFITIMLLGITVSFVTLIQAFINNCFRISFYLPITYAILTFFWTFFIGYVTHGIPVHIFILAYYINLKQKTIIEALDHLNEICHQLMKDNLWSVYYLQFDRFIFYQNSINKRYLSINRQLCRLNQEIREYDKFWRYYLTLAFGMHSVIITYCTYVVFFTELDLTLTGLYFFVGLIHIQFLILLIYNCSRIIYCHKIICIRTLQFSYLSTKIRLFRKKEMIKVENLTQYNRLCQTGFSLMNETLMDSATFVMNKRRRKKKNMLSSLVKEHQLKQIKKREEIEQKRILALSSSTKFTTKLVNHLNDGVSQAYINQRKLDTEAKQLVANVDQFSKSLTQWVHLMNNFNDALKHLGDVDNWAKVIENDMKEISSILEYVYKQSNQTLAGDYNATNTPSTSTI